MPNDILKNLELLLKKIPYDLSIHQEKEIRNDIEGIIIEINKHGGDKLGKAEQKLQKLALKVQRNEINDWGNISDEEVADNYLKKIAHLDKKETQFDTPNIVINKTIESDVKYRVDKLGERIKNELLDYLTDNNLQIFSEPIENRETDILECTITDSYNIIITSAYDKCLIKAIGKAIDYMDNLD